MCHYYLQIASCLSVTRVEIYIIMLNNIFAQKIVGLKVEIVSSCCVFCCPISHFVLILEIVA
jgi:hypothetical protein